MAQVSSQEPKGPIAWMARNRVAANLLMALFILGGLLMAIDVKQEIFPSFQLDIVQVQVPYPGASPADVEQGILLAIEDEVRGIEGVKEITSSAFEGRGLVSVELLLGSDRNKALQNVKNKVDSILSFPEEAERPVVSLLDAKRQVISLIVHGRTTRKNLRLLTEEIRDELLQLPSITLVELDAGPITYCRGNPPIPTKSLRSYIGRGS